MLQAIRDKAQGWIAWAIVILISIPFALWGIQEYLGVGGDPVVASVDGDEITERTLDERTREMRQSMRASLGDAYRADLLPEALLRQQALDTLIEQRLLIDRAGDWNLRASDAQVRGYIASMEAFQRDGRFDRPTYEASVRNLGYSTAGFEEGVRTDLLLLQISRGIRNSTFVTDRDIAERIALNDERRRLAFARVAAADFVDEVEVDAAALRAFYDANTERYRTPEQVRVSYLLLDSDSLGELVRVDEASLRQYFEDHRTEFVLREERAMRHILVAVPPGADAAARSQAEQEALDLLQRLRAGEEFAALAREYSDDPGSAQNGGDLGWVERGLMVPDFEEAGFALEQGAISEPIETEFGFHLIQVTDIRGGSDAGFDELRGEVEAAYRRFEAENLYFDYAERLAQVAYENPGSLAPAAESLGLEVATTDWLTREASLPPPLDSPRVVNAAFSEDVLGAGNNSELLEVGPLAAVVLRVSEHRPAGVEPFDEIRAQIEQDFKAEQAAERAREAGEAALERLASGSSALPDLARDRNWTLHEEATVGRRADGVPRAVLAEAFSLAPPAAGTTAHAGVRLDNGDYALIAVSGVEKGEPGDLADADREEIRGQLRGRMADVQYRDFNASLRRKADIEVALQTGE
jgi:peptidyl-prolyl cis-trans isomerase D